MLDDCRMHIKLPLSGGYNIYNATAALSSKFLLGGLGENEAASLKDFKPQFGRSEKFKVDDKEGNIFLIKNPVGATQILQTILPNISKDDTLLIALNDNFADGTDVSWIWDIALEQFKIKNVKCKIFVSGIRAYDMALRLKYAGVDENQIQINPNLESTFEKATKEPEGKLFILPTYTALLELQKILVKKGIKKEYWKE
jgi:UDP-N-acetylmuramyl tripeptide synthase